MSEFKTIETQEELDKIIKSRLERERSKYSDYDSLSEKIKNLETENLNLKSTLESQKDNENINTTKITELEKEISNYKLSSLKQQVALKNGLPFELSDRLTGADEESLTADAERLASFININKSIPLKDTEPVAESGVNAALRQVVRDLK